MRTHHCLIVLILAALVCAGPGCTGRGSAIATSGVVIGDDGKPLAHTRVTFTPVNGGPISFGQTDGQGRFSLTTADGKEGAYPGEYKVTLLVTGDVGEADAKIVTNEKAILKERDRLTRLRRTAIHANYGSVDKTPLKVGIPADGELKLTLSKNGT